MEELQKILLPGALVSSLLPLILGAAAEVDGGAADAADRVSYQPELTLTLSLTRTGVKGARRSHD